ncbi:hypothetical protein MK079_01195 [Candidatus Gracilibacteria bacterium]|nr:hypothetical protein [Candidatus Gracilibacteria bacterium]
MKTWNTFYFENFSFHTDSNEAVFCYSFDREEFFEEKIIFPRDFEIRKDIDTDILDTLLFQVHLALGMSYYKLCPTKQLVIGNGKIDDVQKKFWEKFYLHGLGEFFITQDIDPSNLISFTSSGETFYSKKNISVCDKSLLPWGGGKDSIVSSILLKNHDFSPYVFGKIDTIKKNTLELLGKKPLNITRQLSPKLFELNAQGYPNGHVPITGMIACISFVAAYLYNYKNIILSNEHSADEPNVNWKGIDINHQYSKSFEFEKDLKEYAQKYITQDIQYFSLLRGMHEYTIAQIFSSQASKYFSTFSSCNKNFTITSDKKHLGNWCGKCEKCCFVYALFSAFLDPKEMEKIFGKNLFYDSDLLVTFSALIGHGSHKPFECVGTYEETIYALQKALSKYSGNLPFVLQELKEVIQKKYQDMGGENLGEKLGKIHDDDIIPPDMKKSVPILSSHYGRSEKLP